MTLTKSHLINAIAEQNGFTRTKSSETVETILELIKSTLASGDDVLISGFGKKSVFESPSNLGFILEHIINLDGVQRISIYLY